MRRLTNTLLFLWVFALGAVAQDFKLYYAKNVTDVKYFSDDVNELARQLDWKEVVNGSIDGNQVEVYEVKEMLKSTRMKGLADQQQFWRMRDHTLLCFRINDGSGKTGSYNVEVDYGKNTDGQPVKKSLTTSNYFFANMPFAAQDITIKVWDSDAPEHPVKFRYSVYDWDDQNVYMFQLDQKRQSTGDTYRMEYVTAYADAEGELKTQSTILELKETKFQSFYLPEGHSLTDIYFLTGNSQEGDVKMRLNLNDIHPGIDMDWRLNAPQLTTKFFLDKHENREMVNFNWIGTGLFEKYDTLFMKLYDYEGEIISDATMNVHRVDAQGNKVNDTKLRYLGYDEESEQHMVLTYGHPAYIEILADGCLPTLYRYKGAADAATKIVSEDFCSAKLTLREGSTADGDIGITDQHLRYLNDLHVVVSRSGEDYTICDVNDLDLASKLSVDTLVYMENGGNDYLKLLNNKPVTRYAQMEVTFSSPKGSSTPNCWLTATELQNKVQHKVTDQEVVVVTASEFKNFTRDYYFVRLSLVDVVPENSVCSLKLETNTSVYEGFPMMMNLHFDPDEKKKEGEEQTAKNTTPNDNTNDVAKANDESALGISFPPTFKFNLGPMKMKTGLTIDVLKQTMSMFISGSVNSQNDEEGDNKKLSKARENAKNMAGWNYSTFKGGKDAEGKDITADASFAEAKLKYEDWVLKESGSIFDVSATHVGFYYGGGLKVALQAPLPDITKTQIQEASVFVEGGAGMAWGLTSGKKGSAIDDIFYCLSLIGIVPDVGAVFDANLKLDAGLKSFDNKMASRMSAKNMGLFSNLTFSVRAGAWLGFQTPQTCLGGFKAGFRGGVKGAIQGGVAVPLDASEAGYGGRFMALGIVEFYAQLRALFFHWNKSVYARVGRQWLFPNSDVNPFHDKFPYWLQDKKGTTRTIANSFRRLKAPEPSSLGTCLIGDVSIDANPHFIDKEYVVYNDLGVPGDYNDDRVSLYHMENKTSESLSVAGNAATQHMRSKRGKPEVVVFQQLTQKVASDEVTNENAVVKNNEILRHTCIRSSFHQNNGTWKVIDVTPDDGYIDQIPVVTIQEDGKAACIYQHGQMALIDGADADSVMNYRLTGELQLRTYDGNKWSEPTKLFDIDADHQPAQYDLFMRGDTVLVGVNMTDATSTQAIFRYASKPLASPTVTYIDEDLQPSSFFMNRVGRNAVIAMVYERPDSTHSVYVKTLAMNGQGDGRSGCDLGLSQSTPDRVKIICDRSDDTTDDFAVLWTETNNILRDAAEGNSANMDMGSVLNASRIHLSASPTVTYPLTVGAERDSLFLTDFDGFLDDDRISVVYSLADPGSGSAVIMHNEKYFTNGFESDVTYTREALLGSSTLPVNVTISNIGTSAINSANVTINGYEMVIDDAFVPPLQKRVFTVQYPIPADFNGYMQSEVSVTYDNVFKTRLRRTSRGVVRNLLRQTAKYGTEHIAIGDVDCNVVNRKVEDGGVNIFTVELTDRSSRGLIPESAVLVGIYPHVGIMQTLTGQAQTLVKAEDFRQVGGVRKAYAKVYVSGISEPVSGYIVPHIVDLSVNPNGSTSVTNIRASRNAPYVNLFPSADPTKIVRHSSDKEPEGHRVGVRYETGGVRLTNLEKGDEVRLFNAQGFAFYIGRAEATDLFIPLTSDHSVYILSAGGEVFKFKY
ncbi:MAG: hypothetical protein J6W38_02270 [Prevotella sp.]|nr:hypothetical protein [Prevotella sp.]